jgi:hypothetical protein
MNAKLNCKIIKILIIVKSLNKLLSALFIFIKGIQEFSKLLDSLCFKKKFIQFKAKTTSKKELLSEKLANKKRPFSKKTN